MALPAAKMDLRSEADEEVAQERGLSNDAFAFPEMKGIHLPLSS